MFGSSRRVLARRRIGRTVPCGFGGSRVCLCFLCGGVLLCLACVFGVPAPVLLSSLFGSVPVLAVAALVLSGAVAGRGRSVRACCGGSGRRVAGGGRCRCRGRLRGCGAVLWCRALACVGLPVALFVSSCVVCRVAGSVAFCGFLPGGFAALVRRVACGWGCDFAGRFFFVRREIDGQQSTRKKLSPTVANRRRSH